MNLTPTIAQSLDTARRITLGSRARLASLALDSERGYTLMRELKKGWLVTDESEGEGASSGQLKCEVAATRSVTDAELRGVAAFAFQQRGEAEARICKVVSRQEPVGELSRVWSFSLTPTGETIAIDDLLTDEEGDPLTDEEGNDLLWE